MVTYFETMSASFRIIVKQNNQQINSMKHIFLLLIFAVFALPGNAQTVENIRVTQDGDQLKITYRIGASTESQLYNVFLSCSMDGMARFEPEAVIGDVGENVVGGKSYYMIMWDVFEDVDEVINPNITVRVELVSDANGSAAAATRTTTEPEKNVQEEPKPQVNKQAEKPVETVQKKPSNEPDPFRRNGFLNYSGMTGYGTTFGITFGSLNNWGYYVTPLRIAFRTYETYDSWNGGYDPDFNLNIAATAGVTKHIVSAGPYRLHGYGGVGSHLAGVYMATDPFSTAHVVIETGVINVIGGFNVTLGYMHSIGYVYPGSLVFGLGFVF